MRYFFVFFAVLFLVACSKPEKPIFKKVENITFNSLSIKKPYSVKLNADAIFNNPNALGAQIKAMDFDVYINGKKTNHIEQKVSTKMPANSDFTLPIICSVSLKDIFQELKIKDLLKAKTIKYRVDGHLTIDLGGVGIDIPFDHEGEEKLSL